VHNEIRQLRIAGWDTSAAEAAVAELERIVAVFPPHLVDQFANALDELVSQPSELFIAERNYASAVGAYEIWISLKPSRVSMIC
jgi:hypothetical protein